VAASTDPRIGAELLGYRIEALVGRGGMGVVYRAYDLRLKRLVAIKLIAPELSENVSFRERFLAETELAASLEHPNVVPIHDAGEVDGQLYLAMRYVEDGELKSLLQREERLEPARAVAICAQIAAALDAAHARGLIHRDVKPSNVLLNGNEHVYLADFGLSRQLADPGVPGEQSHSVGTPAYAAPEQIEGGEVDGRADVYSLGCLLYECLLGEPPYPRDSDLAVLWAHLQEPPPKASERDPRLPPAVDAVVANALAKKPGDRQASCGELVAAAREALGLHQPVTIRDRKALILTALGVAIAAAAVIAGVLLSRGSGAPGRPSTKPTLAPKVDSLQRIDPRTNKLVATIGVDHNPDTAAAGAGRVWVGSEENQSVLRIDPKANNVTGRVNTAGPNSIAATSNEVYVTNTDGTLSQIDPSTLALSNAPNSGYRSVAVGEDAIWTVGYKGLVHVNYEGVVVRRVLHAGFSPFAVATGGGAVWVLDDKLRSLWRVDPRTDRIVKRIRLGFDPGGLAFGLGRVWVTDNSGDAVAEVDPATDRIVRSIQVGDGPIGVAVGSGSVWTANYRAGTVSRIDPKGGTVTATIKVGLRPRSIATGEGGIWVPVQVG
jgi:YVTN family beta-propeller protein